MRGRSDYGDCEVKGDVMALYGPVSRGDLMSARIKLSDLPAAMRVKYRGKRSVKLKPMLRGEACMLIYVCLPWAPALNNLAGVV